MKQPFTSPQIHRFLLLYTGIVAILVLFFLLNKALNPVEIREKRVFNASPKEQKSTTKETAEKMPKEPSRFLLLPKRQ